MKTRIATLFIILFAVFSIVSASDIEVLYGTWANEEYENYYGKYIYNSDGTGLHYSRATLKNPDLECRFTIEERWTDRNGCTYYKILFQWGSYPYDESTPKKTWFIVIKIDPSGNVMETVGTKFQYPEEISPLDGSYMIHYRQ